MRELRRELLRGRGGLDRRRRRSRRAARARRSSTSTSPCASPKRPRGSYASESGGAPFPLSERHGAWRVASRTGARSTSRRCPGSIEADLATRDFTINAIAERVARRRAGRPVRRVRRSRGQRLRAVGESVFEDDPLRLLRAVRLEDELGLPARRARRRSSSGATPSSSRGRRGSGSSPSCGGSRPTASAARRARPARARSAGRSTTALDRSDSPDYRLVAVFGEDLRRLPVSNELAPLRRALLRAEPPRTTRPARSTASAGDRALGARGARVLGASELAPAVEQARAAEPAEPLAARRRARAAARPRDRPTARRDRGGARGGHDRDEGGGARAMHDAMRDRFAKTAERVAALQDARAAELEEKVVRFVSPTGDERALDVRQRRRARSPSRSRRSCARWSRSTSCPSCSRRAAPGGPLPERQLRRGRRDEARRSSGRVRPGRLAADAAPRRRGRSSWSPSSRA